MNRVGAVLAGLAVPFVASGSALAELTPAEVVVVSARGNRESEALARYYMKVRAIPAENLCQVDVPKGEVCPRKEWTWAVRPEVRKWLDENDPQGKIRCLTTTWGIPLKIDAGEAEPAHLRYQTYLAGEREKRLELLEAAVKGFDELAAGLADEETGAPADGAEGDAATPAPSKPGDELAALRLRLEARLRAAQQRIGKMPQSAERLAAQQRLQQLVTLSGGVNVLLQGLAQQNAAGPAQASANTSFQNLRGVQAGWSEARALLEQFPPTIERDAVIMALLERLGGQLAVLPWLDEQLKTAQGRETSASFDSELALVMWPDDYQLLRWQPNYLRPAFDKSQLRQSFRTLMVARLDGPSLRQVKQLIDTSLEVEAKGLAGKAYFDARGMAKLENPPQPLSPGSYEDYDRALLVTARGINEQTDVSVVLNEKPELFQAGECPDAALYCGWYSLAKYVDAFDWAPGAVAYHLASAEGATLHDPDTQQWCKNMLEDGVCATIGPAYEPYLASFPRPEEFFALLLQGKLTLAECYWQTCPFTSWMQTLVGDPLYRPYKQNPALLATPTPMEGASPGLPGVAPPAEAADAPAATPETPAAQPAVSESSADGSAP